METEVRHKILVCEDAQNAEWDDIVARMANVGPTQRAYLNEHPPGLVKALWAHFHETRERCGCTMPRHERPGCVVRLIERLLLDEQSA